MKIAILGTAYHRMDAPFDDLSWEIWALREPNLPRYSRWFELHDLAHIQARFPQLYRWLLAQDGTKPVYMRWSYPEVPGSIAYPRDAMIERFGPNFFSSTIAWMMARAIAEGPEAIGLWGVDMVLEDEYAHQRPACRHFIEIAKLLGIDTVIAEESALRNPEPLYALGDA